MILDSTNKSKSLSGRVVTWLVCASARLCGIRRAKELPWELWMEGRARRGWQVR